MCIWSYEHAWPKHNSYPHHTWKRIVGSAEVPVTSHTAGYVPFGQAKWNSILPKVSLLLGRSICLNLYNFTKAKIT